MVAKIGPLRHCSWQWEQPLVSSSVLILHIHSVQCVQHGWRDTLKAHAALSFLTDIVTFQTLLRPSHEFHSSDEVPLSIIGIAAKGAQIQHMES